jgi:Fe-S oxidoreductase
LLKHVFGVHPGRRLPRLAPQSFRSWFGKRPSAAVSEPTVILFPDTFTNFFEPHVAQAAVEVLERAGFQVRIPASDLCCGRPLFDQGMLGTAKRWLQQVMASLAPLADEGRAIVGLEPSCLLTFRDELPALFPGDPRVQKLARSALMFDEFIAREAPGLSLPALHGNALLHGHCHQKALAGLDSEIAILKRIPSLDLRVPDSGCCGMAGAFGYDAEHFEISRAIGERVLLPAVRAADPNTLIISDGYSCRSQIAQFCPGRKALHLAEVLNMGS